MGTALQVWFATRADVVEGHSPTLLHHGMLFLDELTFRRDGAEWDTALAVPSSSELTDASNCCSDAAGPPPIETSMGPLRWFRAFLLDEGYLAEGSTTRFEPSRAESLLGLRQQDRPLVLSARCTPVAASDVS